MSTSPQQSSNKDLTTTNGRSCDGCAGVQKLFVGIQSRHVAGPGWPVHNRRRVHI